MKELSCVARYRIESTKSVVVLDGCRIFALTILHCARKDDARVRVCKPRQLDAVLLAKQGLVMSTFLDVVYLNRLVAIRGHAEFAVVVVVDRLHIGRRSTFLDVLALEELLIESA